MHERQGPRERRHSGLSAPALPLLPRLQYSNTVYYFSHKCCTVQLVTAVPV